MKRIIIVMAVALFVAAAGVQAQSLEEVLKNYHETMGQEVLLKTKTYQSNGKMIQGGMEIPFVQYAAHPDKFRVEATFQGMTLVQTFNGDKGWAINPFAGQTEQQPMSEEEVKSMKLQADYEGLYWNWKEKGHKLTLEANEEIEGSDCFVVRAESVDGDEVITYIDAENYIPLKTKIKATRMGQEVESETFMSNYNEIDGYVFAGKVETRVGGQITATIVIDEMIMDPELDLTMFDSATK